MPILGKKLSAANLAMSVLTRVLCLVYGLDFSKMSVHSL